MSDRMNQHDAPTPDRDELRDRLIDAALRERLGGETPPDLSAAILKRASADRTIISLTQEATMSTPTLSPRLRALRYVSIAATLLIAAGMLLLPAKQAAREAARRTVQPDDSASMPTPRPSGGKALSSSNHSSQSQNAAQGGRDELMLGVTPHIIIEEEEEERLGIAPESPSSKPSETGSTFQSGPGPGEPGSGAESRPTFLGVRSTNAEPVAEASGVHHQRMAPPSRPALESQPMSSQHSWMAMKKGSGLMAQGNTRTRGGEQQAESAGRVYRGETPLRRWHNTDGYAADQGQPEGNIGLQSLVNDAYGILDAAGGNQPVPPTDAREAVRLKEQIVVLEAELQSKLATSRNPNSGDLRQAREQVDRLADRIRRLEGGLKATANRDQYARITENPFLPVSAANTDHRLSTFSIDVDTASYANVRQFLTQSGMLPPPDAVRIEELVNYFDYAYTPPTGDVPFAAHVEVAGCPWAPEHRLVRVGIKGREIERTQRPLSNLVFLIDVSGSMNEPNKLPLLVEGMKRLTHALGENDRVAIVVYASSEGLALESTPGTDQSKIIAALDQLRAGGSTAGGAGIQLAYQVAQQNFIKGAVNRVILCTDGDFNVGVTSPADLERMAETNAKETGVFLTVLGFGRGNLNDAMMEQIADKGNGNYHYIDTDREARKVLVEEMTGTLVTIAKDVKIQIEFNPVHVAGYRLIGYENRVLAAEDFNNDKKDAGEIGAGHTVTALYEIIPAGQEVPSTPIDDLKYAPGAEPLQRSAPPAEDSPAKTPSDADAANELLTLKIRYKAPDGDVSSKLEFPIVDAGGSFAQASEDLQFAAAVAGFGMLLRDSQYKGNASFAGMAEIAAAASKTHDPHGYRREFVELAKRAGELAGE
jgi:Ca-activated chloride channel family protein